MVKGSKRNPVPIADAVASICYRLAIAPVGSVEELTDVIAGDWADLLGFREKVGFAIATATMQYRTGQQSLTTAVKSITYSVKSIREWYGVAQPMTGRTE